MRTTLDIADDVLQAAKELADRTGSTAGKVLSDLARRGLASPRPAGRADRLKHGVPVIAPRGDVITLEHVRRLQDEDGI
jgi:hypothetical protein